MKKLLVIAMISVFAVSAFAVDATFDGRHEINGYFYNFDEADESSASYYHYARFFGHMNLDPKTNFHFRAVLSDAKMNDTGRSNNFDRVWADYMLMDGLKLTVGRFGSDYANDDFATAWYNAPVAGGEGTDDAIRFDYTVSSDITAFLALQKIAENSPGSNDTDLYIVGAKMKFADLGIYPVLSYFHGQTDAAIGAHVNAQYLPATGVQVKGTVAVYNQIGDKYDPENPMLFGVYVDGAYVTDMFKAGAFVAYGSSDNDTKTAFSFGNDWNKTMIIDDGIRDGSSTAGFLQAAVYANVKPVDKLTVSAIFAYYMNMADTGVGSVGGASVITSQSGVGTAVRTYEDANMMEVDASVKYQLTDITYIMGGVAYAMYNDVAAKDDEEKVMTAFWQMRTEF